MLVCRRGSFAIEDENLEFGRSGRRGSTRWCLGDRFHSFTAHFLSFELNACRRADLLMGSGPLRRYGGSFRFSEVLPSAASRAALSAASLPSTL